MYVNNQGMKKILTFCVEWVGTLTSSIYRKMSGSSSENILIKYNASGDKSSRIMLNIQRDSGTEE